MKPNSLKRALMILYSYCPNDPWPRREIEAHKKNENELIFNIIPEKSKIEFKMIQKLLQ